MKRFDLHVHSVFSADSATSVEKLVERYAALKFAGFALTDHDSIGGWKRAKDHIRRKKFSFEFIPACEFKTARGDLIGLFLTDMITSRDPLEVIDQIHAQGGLAILPHPFDFFRGRSAMSPARLGKEGAAKLDGIETFNARATVGANKKAEVYSRTARARAPVSRAPPTTVSSRLLAKTGGSDAHFLFEAGAGYTRVPEGMELETAIRHGRTHAGGVRSPFYVHGPTTLVKWAKKAGLMGKV